MITITFAEFQIDGEKYNGVATIRESGSEPKLKYYVEACGVSTKEKTKRVAQRLAETVIQKVLFPEKNGLVAPQV